MLILCLLFLYLGVFYNLAGVATQSVAAKLNVESYMVGYAFSLYSIGQTAAVMGNARFLQFISPQLELIAAAGVAVTGIICLTNSLTLWGFGLSALACGIGSGIFISVGNHTCVSAWDGRGRAVRLNLINFFFSFGAIISPVVAGWLLSHGLGWEIPYWWTGLLAIVAAGFSRYLPKTAQGEACQPLISLGRWPIGVYLSAVALFAYVLSEVMVSFWLVSYLQQHLGLEITQSAVFLSIFWGTIAVGRFISGFLARWFAAVHMILAGSALAFLSFAGLLLTSNVVISVILTACTGLGYSCLYASILTFGTQCVFPSPRVTTFYVSVGCAGGILSYLVSSMLNQLFSLQAAMVFAAGLIGAVFVLIAVAGTRQENRKLLPK